MQQYKRRSGNAENKMQLRKDVTESAEKKLVLMK